MVVTMYRKISTIRDIAFVVVPRLLGHNPQTNFAAPPAKAGQGSHPTEVLMGDDARTMAAHPCVSLVDPPPDTRRHRERCGYREQRQAGMARSYVTQAICKRAMIGGRGSRAL